MSAPVLPGDGDRMLPRAVEGLSVLEIVDLAAGAVLDGLLAQEGEREASARAMYFAARGEEDLARKHTVLALCLARRVALELGPGEPGRPRADESTTTLELGRKERHLMRLLWEPRDHEFRQWIAGEESPTKSGLARYGARLRRERDRETGEPILHETQRDPQADREFEEYLDQLEWKSEREGLEELHRRLASAHEEASYHSERDRVEPHEQKTAGRVARALERVLELTRSTVRARWDSARRAEAEGEEQAS